MTIRIESSNLLLRFVKKLPHGYHIFKIVFCSSGIARFSTYFCLIFPLRQPEVTTKKLCGMTSKNQNVILCKITVKYLQNVKILHANTNAKTWRFQKQACLGQEQRSNSYLDLTIFCSVVQTQTQCSAHLEKKLKNNLTYECMETPYH